MVIRVAGVVWGSQPPVLMDLQSNIQKHPLFDLVKRFCDLLESGGKDGIRAFDNAGTSVEACSEGKIEAASDMENMLYFCMYRTVAVLLEVKDFDASIKDSLIDYQIEMYRLVPTIETLPEISDARRERHPPNSKDILLKWYYEHSYHPYPAKDELLLLANMTGLTIEQVRNWFNNARKRISSAGKASKAN